MVLQIENRTSETFLIFCVPFRLYYFQKIVYTGMQSFLNCLIKGLEFSYIFISLFLVRVLTGNIPIDLNNYVYCHPGKCHSFFTCSFLSYLSIYCLLSSLLRQVINRIIVVYVFS